MTHTADRIVESAERQARWEETAPTPKRPQGRAGHLSAETKYAIRLAHLKAGGQVTNIALAAQFNVNRDTIGACLKGLEFDALQSEFLQELRTVAANVLKGSMVMAADQWRAAIPIAALKGDHRPSRDLLLHTGVIEPVGPREGSGLVVQIGGGSNVQVNVQLSPTRETPD